ncbi:MAG TPA: hypothetical protein ENI17_16210 [Pseudomonas xinjiangensis]|uniref:YniB-like protein n=2 Tax=root TaxID=1 RepID=A0A7V1BKT6_9GAMM|nr:hypothetical protein [Halopseudomonas xinjiangensis]HEC49147.1 hypothetical protein [Halopseudomonas xinjiangensis]
MKLKQKMKNTGRNSRIAYLMTLLTLGYLLMTSVKGAYFQTSESSYSLVQNIHIMMGWAITHSYFFPINLIWNNIPAIPFDGQNLFLFFKIIAPPIAVLFVCALFIVEHRLLKEKFQDLRHEIKREIALRDMRKDAGIESIPESATVDVIISNATTKDPSWHDTWWGRVGIGVTVAIVVAAIGIK